MQNLRTNTEKIETTWENIKLKWINTKVGQDGKVNDN